jgi:hypothetical protein
MTIETKAAHGTIKRSKCSVAGCVAMACPSGTGRCSGHDLEFTELGKRPDGAASEQMRSPLSVATTEKKPAQAHMFDGYKTMTLLDLLRMSGKLRRQAYAKSMAHEAAQKKAQVEAEKKAAADGGAA